MRLTSENDGLTTSGNAFGEARHNVPGLDPRPGNDGFIKLIANADAGMLIGGHVRRADRR